MKTAKSDVFVLLVLLVLIFSMAACEGPAGPQGEQGIQGEQGLQGEDGNANVIYSDWMNIVWEPEDPDDPTSNSMRIPEARIMEDFLDSGFIALYIKQVVPNAVVTAPLPIMIVENEYIYFATAIASAPEAFQGVILYQRAIDGVTPLSFDMTSSQVRYVLIPGSQQIGSETSARSLPVDLENYEQVKKYFDIPD